MERKKWRARGSMQGDRPRLKARSLDDSVAKNGSEWRTTVSLFRKLQPQKIYSFGVASSVSPGGLVKDRQIPVSG
jgi:hypothetical protein